MMDVISCFGHHDAYRPDSPVHGWNQELERICIEAVEILGEAGFIVPVFDPGKESALDPATASPEEAFAALSSAGQALHETVADEMRLDRETHEHIIDCIKLFSAKLAIMRAEEKADHELEQPLIDQCKPYFIHQLINYLTLYLVTPQVLKPGYRTYGNDDVLLVIEDVGKVLLEISKGMNSNGIRMSAKNRQALSVRGVQWVEFLCQFRPVSISVMSEWHEKADSTTLLQGLMAGEATAKPFNILSTLLGVLFRSTELLVAPPEEWPEETTPDLWLLGWAQVAKGFVRHYKN